MSNIPLNQNGRNGGFRFDRREFILTGLAIAATTMFPRSSVSAQTTQPMVSDRRRLGTLEVSAVSLGVQNMSRTYQ